ncbi:MAG: hypothetical protein ACM3PW_05430 [Chlamydiota bacterium]
MALYELHPFTDSEIAAAPEEAGVYVLFQVETPLHVDGAPNLRQRLISEKARVPQATHFAVETGHKSERDRAKRVEQLKQELSRVRVGWFAGPVR